MKSIRTYILIFLLSVGMGTTASCSVWDMVKPSPGLNVETEFVAGGKSQAVNTDVGHTTQTADEISIQNIEEVPLSFMVLAMLGWLLPSPGAMWRGFLQLLPWVSKKE